MSLQNGKPMVMKRKEQKKYGTKKLIEGVFSAGDRCLVVDGSSYNFSFQTKKKLFPEGQHPFEFLGEVCGERSPAFCSTNHTF